MRLVLDGTDRFAYLGTDFQHRLKFGAVNEHVSRLLWGHLTKCAAKIIQAGATNAGFERWHGVVS